MVPLEYNTLMRSCHHCLKFSRMWGHSCCSFRTLVRAHRKRRSTAGHGGFYVIFASVRRVSRHHGVGWGGVGQWWRSFGLDHVVDATPRIGMGWGGVGQWWRSFGLDHVVDATPRIGVGWGGAVMTFLWTWSRCWCYATHWGGVGWGSDDVPLDLITLLMLRHALGWGGVGQWWRSFGLDHVVGFHNQICTQNIYIHIFISVCICKYIYIDIWIRMHIDILTSLHAEMSKSLLKMELNSRANWIRARTAVRKVVVSCSFKPLGTHTADLSCTKSGENHSNITQPQAVFKSLCHSMRYCFVKKN